MNKKGKSLKDRLGAVYGDSSSLMEHCQNVPWDTSEQYLPLFKRNPKKCLRRFLTDYKTWIHWYTPETKEQRTSPGERAPKKTKTVLSAGKVMVSVF